MDSIWHSFSVELKWIAYFNFWYIVERIRIIYCLASLDSVYFYFLSTLVKPWKNLILIVNAWHLEMKRWFVIAHEFIFDQVRHWLLYFSCLMLFASPFTPTFEHRPEVDPVIFSRHECLWCIGTYWGTLWRVHWSSQPYLTRSGCSSFSHQVTPHITITVGRVNLFSHFVIKIEKL